jgi:hypothetical protein
MVPPVAEDFRHAGVIERGDRKVAEFPLDLGDLLQVVSLSTRAQLFLKLVRGDIVGDNRLEQ